MRSLISDNLIKLMVYNCATYYHNGTLKSIKLNDGSIIHYDEDGHFKYVQLSNDALEKITR